MSAVGRAVIAASIAHRPHRPGHTEAMLQWALGLRQLGWQVTVLDRLHPGMAVDTRGQRCAAASSENARYLSDAMDGAGLGDAWALLADTDEPLGMSRAALRERMHGALLIDVMGFLGTHPLAELAERRVLVDLDPGYTQIWQELGLADLLGDHDRFVTVALCMGEPGCGVPECGVRWISTLPPVVLDRWVPQRPGAGPFSTVGSWRGPWGVLERDSVRLGQRAHTFRELVDLPRLCGRTFDVALEIDPADADDRSRLEAAGWTVRDPVAVAPDRERYRALIIGSSAELCVAKEIYVRTRSGWFSDRSACYLASGRPVVALDTGFSHHLPVGDGLIAFDGLEAAGEAVSRVDGDRERQARAARTIAEDHLDARRVLARVVEEVWA